MNHGTADGGFCPFFPPDSLFVIHYSRAMPNFLTEIEVQGFKSFANKTGFRFPTRIVAVVGPNGSGKSNIVDALRWVLGERAAKHLRGDSLGNLIFSGTPKRPAAGLARVVLRFDNSARHFPFETEEVVIERRIDRSGNSQFFVNSAETRLREISPIFARAKMGTRGLTIIGQGQSDLFVRSSPEERRLMIEEILGLKEFRLKKQEAERELQNTRGNMERAQITLEEIRPRLDLLLKQKTRWSKREEIECELKELEGRYFSFHAEKIARDMSEALRPIGDLERRKAEKEGEVRVLEERLERPQQTAGAARLPVLRQERQRVMEALRRRETELVRLETRREMRQAEGRKVSVKPDEMEKFGRGLLKGLRRAIGLGDLEEVRSILRGWLSDLERLFEMEPRRGGADDDGLGRIRELKAGVAELGRDLGRLDAEEEKIQVEERAGQKRLREEFVRLEQEKNAVRDLERIIQEKRFAVEKIKMREEELRNLWISFGKTETGWSEVMARARAGRGHCEAPSGDALEKLQRMRGELSAIGEVEEEVLKEAEETEKRYNFLTGELSDIRKASGDLERVIGELDRNIHKEFGSAFHKINSAFDNYFGVMFGGGRARMRLTGREEEFAGVEIEVAIPRKKIKSLDMLSGGERSLVSLAALFALVSTSEPPFLVLDEIDAALDDENARRFAELIKKFSDKTQFLIVTHNRITMETADALYGVTMADDGVSKILSLELGEGA